MTLIFLALWHGLHSGYYHCFFMEFVVTYFERDVSIPLIVRMTYVQNIFEKLSYHSLSSFVSFLLDWTGIEKQ